MVPFFPGDPRVPMDVNIPKVPEVSRDHMDVNIPGVPRDRRVFSIPGVQGAQNEQISGIPSRAAQRLSEPFWAKPTPHTSKKSRASGSRSRV